MKATLERTLRASRLGLLAFLLVWGYLLTGCGEQQQQAPAEEEPTLEVGEEAQDGEVSEQTLNLILSIPSPIEVTNNLQKAGARYEAALLNPEKSVVNYQERARQALNVGVYSVDLSYVTVYNKKEDALKYYAAITRLCDEMDVQGVFTKELKDRVVNNKDAQDSLEVIFNETFTVMHRKMAKLNQQKELALIFAGAWVESQHLGVEIFKLKPTEETRAYVADQQKLIKDVKGLLEPYKDDAMCAKIHSQFEALEKIYDGSDAATKLDDAKLNAILAIINPLRKEIVS